MKSPLKFSNPVIAAMVTLLFACVIWGATGPFMKFTLQTVPIFSLAFIRFMTASLFLLPFIYQKLKVDKKDFQLFLLAAMGGVSVHIPLFFWGVKLTTAINAGIISSSLPIFSLLIAHYLLRDKITRNLSIGAILGMAGILLIIGKDVFSNGITLSPVGDVLILLATICFVMYEMVSKKLSKTYPPLVITFYTFFIGSLALLPPVIFENMNDSTWTSHLSTGVILGILYGIFMSSLLAYSLWEWGLSKIPASRVGFFFYIDPVVSTVVSVLLFSEKITIPFIIGSILIFGGLIFAQGHLPYHPRVFKKYAS